MHLKKTAVSYHYLTLKLIIGHCLFGSFNHILKCLASVVWTSVIGKVVIIRKMCMSIIIWTLGASTFVLRHMHTPSVNSPKYEPLLYAMKNFFTAILFCSLILLILNLIENYIIFGKHRIYKRSQSFVFGTFKSHIAFKYFFCGFLRFMEDCHVVKNICNFKFR